MVVNREFLTILEENHLTSFSSLMDYPVGKVIKNRIPERSTVNFELKSGNEVISVFLKRYHPLPLKDRLQSPFNFFSPYTALREWKNTLTFHSLNLPTVTPVAAGMRKKSILGRESFLLTKGLEGTVRLEDVIHQRFSHSLLPEEISEKRKLIKQLALLTQKMHNLGLNHRDFYLCHILTRKDADRGWELFICDLHRVDRRKSVSIRWRVKDLSALNYSAPEKLISTSDRIRFLKLYLGKERLDQEARLWIKKVVKRTEKMERHSARRRSTSQP
jgi:heptose I phosphotransferase